MHENHEKARLRRGIGLLLLYLTASVIAVVLLDRAVKAPLYAQLEEKERLRALLDLIDKERDLFDSKAWREAVVPMAAMDSILRARGFVDSVRADLLGHYRWQRRRVPRLYHPHCCSECDPPPGYDPPPSDTCSAWWVFFDSDLWTSHRLTVEEMDSALATKGFIGRHRPRVLRAYRDWLLKLRRQRAAGKTPYRDGE